MADIQTTILRRVEAGGFIDSSFVIDAAGNQFLVIGVAEYPPTNNTWAEVYKIPPAGPVPSAPQWRVLPSGVQKIDAVTVYYSGTDLMVELVTHEPGPAPRDTTVELGIIRGVFVYEEGMERHSGGPGAFTGGAEPNPDPGGGGMTVEEMKQGMREVLGVTDPNAPFTQFWGSHRSIRQGIEDKVVDGSTELLTGTDERAVRYKTAMRAFLTDWMAWMLAQETQDPQAQVVKFLLRKRYIEDAAYEAALNALESYGVCTEETGEGVPLEPADTEDDQ